MIVKSPAMRELIIRSASEPALQRLEVLLRWLGFHVTHRKPETKRAKPPVSYAEEPDFRALAGIWADRSVRQEDLRKQAWGGRM